MKEGVGGHLAASKGQPATNWQVLRRTSFYSACKSSPITPQLYCLLQRKISPPCIMLSYFYLLGHQCYSTWDQLINFSQKISAENYQITTKWNCCPSCYNLPETTYITKLGKNFFPRISHLNKSFP